MDDLEKLTETVEAFCQLIESLPPEMQLEQDWGPREVLAHLVYHHELYVGQTRALLSGCPFDLPAGRFSDLNAAAVQMNRGVSAADLLKRLRDANQQLIELCRACDPARVEIKVKRDSKAWRLDALIQGVEGHIRNHALEIRKAARKQGSR